MDEVARLTDSLKDMTEDDQDELNKAFCSLMESESERPLVTVSYFKPASKNQAVSTSHTQGISVSMMKLRES